MVNCSSVCINIFLISGTNNVTPPLISKKKTFYDKIDITSGPIPSSTQGTLNKNYQYGNYNDKDFYYFTGFSISYIFYKIPCPKNSAPKNSIY